MANTEFAEFLKRKIEREAPKGHVDWECRRGIWLAKLQGLFQDVDSWLASYKNEGLLKCVITHGSLIFRTGSDECYCHSKHV